MKVLLKQFEARLPALKVQSIVILPDGKGVEVTLITGGNSIRFRTTDFDIGQRGARTAALARFAAYSGFGDSVAIYRFLLDLPQDMAGILFSAARSAEECGGPGSPNWTADFVA